MLPMCYLKQISQFYPRIWDVRSIPVTEDNWGYINPDSSRFFLQHLEDREPPQMIAGHEQLGDTPVASMKWAKIP